MAGPRPYSWNVAVPLPDAEQVRAEMGSSYDPQRTLNVVKVLAGTGDMFDATVGLVRAVFPAEGVDPEIRQMILCAAKVLNAPYEWEANMVLFSNNGLSPAEIEAAGSDGPVLGIDPAHVLA